MKTCTNCNEEKPVEEFNIKNKVTGKRHSYCKSCKREMDRNSYQTNFIRAEKIRINARNSILRCKTFSRRVKQKCVCYKCGENRWYVLDFHHTKTKASDITELIKRGVSLKKLKQEIKKCRVFCSNCHREEHYLKDHIHGISSCV